MKKEYSIFLKYWFKNFKITPIIFFLLSMCIHAFGQTTLSVGDVSVIGFNSANPDKIAIILLKDITANTVINITDNGFTALTTARTGEGFLTYTAPSNQPAGTVLFWTNGQSITGTGWNSAAPTNFALNASGDQLFIFQGNTANWGTQTGITLLWGGNFGTALSATSSAANTVQPSALTGAAFLNLPTASSANTYFANGSTNTTSVTLSNSASNLFTTFGDASKWFGASSTSVTFPTYSITVVSNTPTITTTGTLNAVNTTYGTASTIPTSFTVSGSNLTNDILVTPPTGYEISKTVGGASGYAATQTLTQTSGSVAITTIYVRLKADASVVNSPYSGNVVLSSTGATSVNVPTVSSSVTAKGLTISGITADNKVYDANTTASLSGTPAYVGLENSEIFSVSGTPTASFNTAFVGNAKVVTVTGYIALSTNYTLTQPSLIADITPAPLTIAGASASNKIYDGNNTATLLGTLSGVIGTESVTLNLSGTFSQSTVGDGLSITSTSTITGTDAGNYTLTQPTGLTGNITAKNLTITGLTANNKVFDGNNTATLSGTPVLNGVISGEETNVVLGGTPVANFAQSAIGTGIAVTVTGYTLTGSAVGNYSLTQPTGLTADITAQPTPMISSSLMASATYGMVATSYFITATNSPTSFNATGLPDGLSVNTVTGEISGTPTDPSASPFNVTISATNSGGTGTAVLVYTVSPKPLTINNPLVNTKVYDRNSSATITGTLNGVLNSDVVNLEGTGTFASVSVGNNIAVTSASTLSGADANKYLLTQPSGLTGEITPKTLTVSGTTATNKVYDGNNSATITGMTLNGIISPDEVTVSGTAIFNTINVANNIEITTNLTLSGTDASNYIVTQPSGLSANITPKSLSITGVSANDKVYDGNITASLSGTPTLTGIVGTDDVSVTGTGVATFTNKTVANNKPVNVSGYTLTGSAASNYSISQPTGLTANITPASLTIASAVAQNKVFDGNTTATITGTLSGVISPDVVTLSLSGTFASSSVGNNISVTSTSTILGTDADNYTLTQPTGLAANITASPSLTEVILPQFIQGINGTNTNRIPFAYRATLSNLNPNATYRYYNGVVLGTEAATSNGAGNVIYPTTTGNWLRSSGPSLATAGNYGEFTTDALGSYTGWFITEPSGNATRFIPGNELLMRIMLNNGAGGSTVVTRLTTTNTVKVINTVNSAGVNNGTGLRGNSGASPKNFVFVYDNEAGTGRPISGSFIESDGSVNTTSNSYSAFYANNVDGVNGAYGVIIPNTNTNGIRRIEQRDFSTGLVTGCPATDADGAWNSGANTVNPNGGTTPIIVTLTDAPLNTCVVTNTPPTIVLDVNTTSNYVDGGMTTSPSSTFTTSGVLNDPTDPVKNLGLDFTIGDAETPAANLTVTFTSSNTSVVPNSSVNLTGSGASRNVKITPSAVGYSTITVTVNDGTTTTNFTINYASSAASINTASTRFHTGTSDASTAQMIDSNLMIVGDDENQALRMYDRQNSGLPVNSFNFTSSLGLTDISGGQPREVDIEASAKVGNRIYWMGSHSNAANGNNRPNRYRFFATDISGTGNTTTLSYIGRYDNLKTDLLAWDASNGHGLGANFLGLTASSATGIAPEIADGSGFNIEGFEIAPNNTTAYICFRAPLMTTTTRTKALIVPLTNFADLVSANPTTTVTATFGTPIQMDLGGRAIREIKKNTSGEYLIMAGPNDGATGTAPKDFRFYTWTGNPQDNPIERMADLTALNANGSFESLVDVPSPLNSNSVIQVLVDNGDAIYYNDGIIAKDLPQNNHKKFRSESISLGNPKIQTTITSVSTGNWTDASTWDLGRIPQAGDIVVIDQNHVVTLVGTGFAKDLKYSGTGKLVINTSVSQLNLGL
jgi:hypothetical protein